MYKTVLLTKERLLFSIKKTVNIFIQTVNLRKENLLYLVTFIKDRLKNVIVLISEGYIGLVITKFSRVQDFLKLQSIVGLIKEEAERLMLLPYSIPLISRFKSFLGVPEKTK
jgi:hypothetical protein